MCSRLLLIFLTYLFFVAFSFAVLCLSVVLFYRTQIAMFVDHLDGFRIAVSCIGATAIDRTRELKMPMCILRLPIYMNRQIHTQERFEIRHSTRITM